MRSAYNRVRVEWSIKPVGKLIVTRVPGDKDLWALSTCYPDMTVVQQQFTGKLYLRVSNSSTPALIQLGEEATGHTISCQYYDNRAMLFREVKAELKVTL